TIKKRQQTTGGALGALICLTVLALHAPPATAAWIEDGSVVIQRIWDQKDSVAVPDGEGGVFVVFQDARASTGIGIGNQIKDIYAQRIDGDGNQLWGIAGALVCAATGHQTKPTAVPDGFGGLLIAWTDYRVDNVYADIYAQRFDANGVRQWSADGVPVGVRAGSDEHPSLVADGTGGVYVAWEEYGLGFTERDIYAQRLSPAGAPQWAINGIPVANVFGRFETNMAAISDGNGGVIVGWSDDRWGDADVFGQRLAPNGTKLWATGGVDLTNVVGSDEYLTNLVADDSGGSYAVWTDNRGVDIDIYAIRFDASGIWQWNGERLVSGSPGHEESPKAMLADNGDLIVGWSDRRDGVGDLYAQRLAAVDGGGLWIDQGAPVANFPESQFSVQLTTDGADGVFFTWRDGSGFEGTIRAQRFDPYGTQMWDSLGMPVYEAPSNYPYNNGLVSDGRGGAIAIWDDDRTGNYDVRAQRIEPREGFWGRPEPLITKVADIPGDQGGQVRVSWRGSGHDAVPFTMITHYSVWRATSAAAVAAQKSGGAPLRLVELADITPGFTGRAYRKASGDFYWEYISEQPAIYAPNYSFAAATEADSTAAVPALHYFQIAAHTASQFQTFPSQPDSGASVDNLAPGAPALLAAQRVGGADVDLTWGPTSEVAPDFSQYEIYRSDLPNVPLDAGHFLTATTDTVLTDTAASPGQAYYYVVVAVDVHANQGPPTNEAMVGDSASAVGDPLVLNSPRMLAPSPNPFTTTTMFRVGLPASGSATLEVYDVAGRRMSRTHYADLSQGWQQIRFDGRDDGGQALPSGVYFCRLRAGKKAVTQKMIITR
ncbi:MAG: T9SS type A sorting domain-containing protein, partial [Candidatus Krumholzibacteria bacterium]|nr:T9SS type A sorting domain-containing protein [Candidatus Krumholzibacteria bacterium]